MRVIVLALLMILAACTVESVPESAPFDWREDWEVEEGFSISIDSQGYQIPTAIAFVLTPGPGPKDPLYFVTELQGTVKVVTNDRSVHTFAEGLLQSALSPVAQIKAETGMAGICLDPRHGYVFVTFAYEDADHIKRNNIVRFETVPGTFSIEPTSRLAFTEVFYADETGRSHQIGPCQIKDGLLYVSVGDGFFTPQKSQQLDSVLGKIIRMTLDGRPVSDNPFYQDDDVRNATNFVFAYGLRNPFGLKVVKDKIFVADNGLSTDRFLEVQEGENYLWDATNWSIGSKAAFVLYPSQGVVQLDYYPEGSDIFPERYQRRFFLALSGGGGRTKWPGIMTIEYDLEEQQMVSIPKAFLRHRFSEGQQYVTGVGFGPDGLYFVPTLPNQEGMSAVFRVAYDPSHQHPFTLTQSDSGIFLMGQKGCIGCHTVSVIDRGDEGGTAGPGLETDALVARLKARLHSKEYIRSLEEMDQLDSEPFVSFTEARQEVLQSDGIDRVRTWMKYRIQEPRFDNPNAQMPNLGVSEREAILITKALLKGVEEGSETGIVRRVAGWFLIESPRRLHLVFYFAGGFFLGGITLASGALLYLGVRRLREKRPG